MKGFEKKVIMHSEVLPFEEGTMIGRVRASSGILMSNRLSERNAATGTRRPATDLSMFASRGKDIAAIVDS
jgi:hypothetical protein